MASSNANPENPLPKSLVIRNIMLKDCCEELDEVNRIRQRNDLRRDMARAIAEGESTDAAAQAQQLQSLQRAMDEAAATGFPSSDLLWDYCDRTAIKVATKMTAEGAFALSEAVKTADAEKIIAAYDTICHGNRLQVQSLQQLRDKLVAAIEGADTCADIEKILLEIGPENRDVLLLHRKLLREARPGVTNIGIALDFTDNNRTRANSLLRQVRRYKQDLRSSFQGDYT